MNEFENPQQGMTGDYVDITRAPLAEDEGLAQFLLELDKKIERLDHMLANEEQDKDGNWVKRKDSKDNLIPPIMDDDTRNKFISHLHDFCSRLFTMSYYPDWNDVMRIAREARCDIGDFLVESYYYGKIRCEISFLRVLRDRSTRMVETALLWALGGGMRASLRQSARIIERTDIGGREEKRKKFGIF